MKKVLMALLAIGMLSGLALSLVAESAPAKDQQKSVRINLDPALDAQVDALLALPKAERRAKLKAIPPAERKGLWFKVKQTQALRRGVQPRVKGSGLTAHAVSPKTQSALPRAVGTIAYDSGAFTTSFGGGSIVGNKFDTHTGIPVLTSGVVSTIVAQVAPGPSQTSASAGFVLLGPQTGGGGANAIFSTFTTATGASPVLTFPGLGVNYTGNSFFVLFGDFANSYVPVLGTGTTNAQGHHGVVGYTGGMGPNITGTFNLGGALNSFIRATGDIVPVELMTFSVD